MTKYDYEQGLREFLHKGEFLEFVLENIYKFHLTEGDLAIDGGANRGRHAIPMAHCVGNTGKVVAIEAIPILAAGLKQQTIDMPITVLANALSDQTGPVEFHYCIDCDWQSGLHARKYIQTLQTETLMVNSIIIDDIVGKDERVSFIKLDLEGGEFSALRGAKDTLLRDRPLIVAEHGGAEGRTLYGYTSEEYFEYLHSLGYLLVDLLGRKLTLQQFHKPDVWYFAAVDMRNEKHIRALEFFPCFVIASAQQVMKKFKKEFAP